MYTLRVARSREDGPSSSLEFTFGSTRVPLRIAVGDETADHELLAVDCERLHQLLRTTRIAPAPSGGFVGLARGGRVTIQHDMSEASYQWFLSPPAGWEELADVVDECYRLAATRDSRYLF